jgi:hypothetical protein
MDDLLRGNGQTQATDSVNDETVVQESTAAPALGQATAPLVVSRPASGQTVTVDPAANQTIVLNFDPGAAQVRIEGDRLAARRAVHHQGGRRLALGRRRGAFADRRLVVKDISRLDGVGAAQQIAHNYPSPQTTCRPRDK